jgi:hypothetical protein
MQDLYQDQYWPSLLHITKTTIRIHPMLMDLLSFKSINVILNYQFLRHNVYIYHILFYHYLYIYYINISIKVMINFIIYDI